MGGPHSEDRCALQPPYVYDLTVEGTKNMVALNGMGCRDTFHFAGTRPKRSSHPAHGGNLNLSKRMKTPLRTYKGPVLPRFVRVSDAGARGPVQPDDARLLAGFGSFGPGEYKERSKVELYPWHDGERCAGAGVIAYTQGPRVVCHVYGFQGDVPWSYRGCPRRGCRAMETT